MANIVDKTACEAAAAGLDDGLVPISPFTGLQFHYGMLLGVDDMETGQAYPRGKIRLHNAWLHREGVVWGFDVAFNTSGDLAVKPGLALDAAGHELHLDRPACVDLGKWYAAHQDDASYAFKDLGDGRKQFSLHVVARFKACLTRPVPAVSEPCAGQQSDTAYSRVFETVELLLRPGLSVRKDPGYHRLRILFQLEPDDPTQEKYAKVQTRREAIQAKPVKEQPAAYLDALREFAALDVIDLHPQTTSLFPEDPTELVLADLADIIVEPTAVGGWAVVPQSAKLNVRVRPSHIATATIQELLCGPLFKDIAPEASPSLIGGTRRLAGTLEAAGPAVTDASLAAKSISIKTSRPIAKASLNPAAFTVAEFSDDKGWNPLEVKPSVSKDGIKLEFKDAPTGSLLRLIVRGSGPTPLLAADDFLPLGGVGPDDGVDYVKMFKIKRS